MRPTHLITMERNEEDLSELVSLVKIKVQDVEDEVTKSMKDKQKNELSRKKERENKKLVSLVSLLTNKLLKDITNTRNEIIVRFEQNKENIRKAENRGAGSHSSRRDNEICDRTLEYRIEELSEDNQDILADIRDLQENQTETNSKEDSLVKYITNLEVDYATCKEKEIYSMDAQNKKRINSELVVQENVEIQKNRFEETRTEIRNIKMKRVFSVKSYGEVANQEIKNNIYIEKKNHTEHVQEAEICRNKLNANDSKHKIFQEKITVNSGRIESLVSETEDNFTKLTFFQSRNSHDHIASLIHDFSGKSNQMARSIEQNIDFIRNKQTENASSLNEIEKGMNYTKSKLFHCSDTFKKYFQDEGLQYHKLTEALAGTNHVFNRDKTYNSDHAKRLQADMGDVESNMAKLLNDSQELGGMREKTENRSADGWLKIKTQFDKEQEQNEAQNEKVNNSETKVQNQTIAIEADQKHGLDEVAMIKKSQSEGLLGQFDTIEQRIEKQRSEFSSEVTETKAELELMCKNATKKMKSFIRDRNLELNSVQHEVYRDLRSTRQQLDEEVINFKKSIRESTGEGGEAVRRLQVYCH